MHHQAAVAFEQDDLAILSRRGNAARIGEAVADSAEVAHDMVFLRVPATHGRVEERLVAGATDSVEVLGEYPVELSHNLARVEKPSLDIVVARIDRLVAD